MKNRRKNRSPKIIMLLIGSFIVFLGWSAHQAATRGSDIADRDYYSKGLRYNTTLIEKQAASVLGWKVEVALREHTLDIILHDRQNLPVNSGEATLYLYQPSASSPLELGLSEIRPGTYRLVLPDDLSGEIRARLDLHREGARISRNLLLNL
jgi:nitrogen fixation protein FixH